MEKKEVRKLYRSTADRMLGGVCGGLAEYFSIDSTLMRILWVLFTFAGGAGILMYIIALIIIPLNPGEAVTRKPKSSSAGVIWGTIFIVLGLLILVGNIHWVFFPFFIGHFALFWPILIIAVGLVLIFAGRKELSRKREAEMNELYKMKSGRKFLGIAAGMARYFNIDVSISRLIWVLFILFTGGLGLAVYFVLYFVLPEEPKSNMEESEDVQE